MPNEPTERDRSPHARPIPPRRDGSARAGRGGAAGVLRSRAGIGIAAVAVIAAFLAVTGVFATPNRNPDSIAVAGATTLPTATPVERATATIDAPASLAPEQTPAPTPDATGTPRPTATPAPSPSEPL